MSEDESPFPENEFLVTGTTWLLASIADMLPGERVPFEAIVTFETVAEDGFEYLPVFTDLDLAERCIDRMNGRGKWKPFYYQSLAELETTLKSLEQGGLEKVAFDPEADRVRSNPIAAVIAGLERRP